MELGLSDIKYLGKEQKKKKKRERERERKKERNSTSKNQSQNLNLGLMTPNSMLFVLLHVGIVTKLGYIGYASLWEVDNDFYFVLFFPFLLSYN